MEVVFRYPSKAVQYGYVEVKFTTIEGVAGSLGRRYARAAWEFWQAEDYEIEVMREEARQSIQEGLGASVVAEEEDSGPESQEGPAEPPEKPWDRKPKASKAKPWEDKKGADPKSVPATSEIEW